MGDLGAPLAGRQPRGGALGTTRTSLLAGGHAPRNPWLSWLVRLRRRAVGETAAHARPAPRRMRRGWSRAYRESVAAPRRRGR
jgi:hypothetical protein